MKNKWTTLSEDQEPDGVPQNISELLGENENSSRARRHKIVAGLFAVIGISLIALGVVPMVKNGDFQFAALIKKDAESVDLVPDAETVSGVNLGGKDLSSASPNSETPPEEKNLESPEKKNELSPDEQIIEATKNITEEITNIPDTLDLNTSEKNSPFKRNTHVGTTDRKIVKISDSPTTGTLRGAAPEQNVAKSGAEAWIAGLVALAVGLVLRRKRKTA